MRSGIGGWFSLESQMDSSRRIVFLPIPNLVTGSGTHAVVLAVEAVLPPGGPRALSLIARNLDESSSADALVDDIHYFGKPHRCRLIWHVAEGESAFSTEEPVPKRNSWLAEPFPAEILLQGKGGGRKL